MDAKQHEIAELAGRLWLTLATSAAYGDPASLDEMVGVFQALGFSDSPYAREAIWAGVFRVRALPDAHVIVARIHPDSSLRKAN